MKRAKGSGRAVERHVWEEKLLHDPELVLEIFLNMEITVICCASEI